MNDSMWIYRDPQGLKVLETELEALRKKRYNRLNKPHKDRSLKNHAFKTKDLTPILKENNFIALDKKPKIKTNELVSSYISKLEKLPKEESTTGNPKKLDISPAISPQIIQSPKSLTPDRRQDSDRCLLYLPRLSPEHKFTEDEEALSDISSTVEEIMTESRPITKKRVSFNEELTFIPSDEEEVCSEPKDQGVIMKELLFALNHTPIEKKPPMPFVQTQVVPEKRERKKEPQKLSNRLLDMFQPKKSKQVDIFALPPTKELTHLTKNRPRKPSSLKKNSLTVPAATAQPDWRVRSTTKKFEFVA